MEFPRIKKYNFGYNKAYRIPAENVGRMDKIALELYGSVRMYKALAYANNIIAPIGFRYGVRPLNESIRNELVLKGYTGSELESEYNKLVDDIRQTSNDWLYYGDGTNGYTSDAQQNALLLVPDYQSALTWLNMYEYLD